MPPVQLQIIGVVALHMVMDAVDKFKFIHSAYTTHMLQPIKADDTQNMWK